MTIELSERFRFPGGNEMNGFFIHKNLTDEEKTICLKLMSGGPLGLSVLRIKRKKIPIEDIKALETDGIIIKTSLLQLANELVRDEWASDKYKETEEQGGFLALVNEEEREDFRNYVEAMRIVDAGKNPESEEIRYKVTTTLYDYLDLAYV